MRTSVPQKVEVKMKTWNIEFSRKMYDSLASMFRVLGMEAPVYIKSEDVERALMQMNLLIQKNNIAVHPSVSMQTPVPHHSNAHLKIQNDKLTPGIEMAHNPSQAKSTLVISKVGIVRYQLKNTFTSKGFQVFTIDNPFSGLAEYVKKLYDVVVIDVNDNIQDSLAVIKEIKGHASHNNVNTSVILLAQPNFKLTDNKDIAELVDQVIVKTENWYSRLASPSAKSASQN